MNLIEPRDILCGLASQFVVHNRNIASDCGILMSLRICGDNHGYEKDGSTFHKRWIAHYTKTIHFIVVNPYSVFAAISDRYDWRSISMDEWKNTSNHASCWRTDGFRDIFPETMKAYHVCYDHIPEKHRPVPVSAYITASFSPAIRQPITFVSVTKKSNSDGFYNLKSIRELNPKFPTLEGDKIHGW